MNVIGITNLNAYVSMMSKQGKAQEKMYSYPKAQSFNAKSEKDSYISTFMKKNDDAQKTAKLDGIMSKLKQGRKLSPADMEYLRTNMPSMYEKALKLEKEREEYRKALEKCKTKDEARMVHMQKMAQFAAEMKSARTSKDPETMAWIDVRASAIMNEFVDFVKSDRYDEIPNEYELVIEKVEESKSKLEEEDERSAQDYETEDKNSSDNDKKADNVERKSEPNQAVHVERHTKIINFETIKPRENSTNIRQKDISA